MATNTLLDLHYQVNVLLSIEDTSLFLSDLYAFSAFSELILLLVFNDFCSIRRKTTGQTLKKSPPGHPLQKTRTCGDG